MCPRDTILGDNLVLLDSRRIYCHAQKSLRSLTTSWGSIIVVSANILRIIIRRVEHRAYLRKGRKGCTKIQMYCENTSDVTTGVLGWKANL